MKKGISLIVLVITIIVMIIIAGAIIISMSSTNVVARAEEAVTASDLANAKYAVSLVYADILVENNDNDDVKYTAAQAQTEYEKALGVAKSKFTVTVDSTTLKPTVEPKSAATN